MAGRSGKEHGWSTSELDTVTDVLMRAVARDGDRATFDFSGTILTTRDLDRRSTQLAHGLRARGVEKGQTVVTVLDNNADAVIVWFAINKLGAISVPVNTALKGEFLRHQTVDAGARLLICESSYFDRVTAICDQLPDVTHVLVKDGLPAPADGTFKIESLSGAYIQDETPLGDGPAPSDIAMLIYTAGTTGPSKGCAISHNYACSLARQSIRATGLGKDDVLLTPLPLFHFNATATSVLTTLIVGSKVAFTPRFSVSNFWPEVERTRATCVSILSSMISLLASAPETDVMRRCKGQLRAALGEPFPPDMRAIWHERFGVHHCGANCYGLTEACLLTLLPYGEPAKPGSSGRIHEDFDVRIFNDEDREVPRGTPGEIVCRPLKPHVMFEGYWRRPADTMKVWRNMWMHTGDIGKIDEDGYFYFLDRKKDYLRRRGENISSYEVENAFLQHPDIKEVAVHAILSETSEDEVKVTAVLADGVALTPAALCSWSVDRLPYYAVPRYIEFREALPKNPVGRVQKYLLRDEGCTPATWDREKAGFTFERR